MNISKKNIKRNRILPEVRCKKCNRLLFVGIVEYVEIKCPRCHCLQKIGKEDNKDKDKN